MLQLLIKRLFSNMNSKIIGTHSGTFHCDEALACFMLRQLPPYTNAKIVRSRENSLLDECDIVVDVGGLYDPSKHRYDHHQRTFNMTMNDLRPYVQSNIVLSSAGLVYHHFGEDILQTIYGSKLEPNVLKELFLYVYNGLIKEVDAIDNGIPMVKGEAPQYKISTDLSSRVARLLPPWNAKDNTITLDLFEKAITLTGKEFVDYVLKFRDEFWPARKIVAKAIDNRFNIHDSGSFIELEFCPWKEHLFALEEEQGIEGSLKYCIMKDDSWRVICVPVVPGSFELRTPLLESFRGLRDADLAATSGVQDALFVHSNGFIGGAKTKEGAIALALKTLEAVKNGN